MHLIEWPSPCPRESQCFPQFDRQRLFLGLLQSDGRVNHRESRLIHFPENYGVSRKGGTGINRFTP